MCRKRMSSKTEEQNKAVVKRFIEEMWNQRKLEVADELFAADCVTHQLRGAEDPNGAPRSPDLVKREAAGWLGAFPDLTFILEQMIAADDQVVSRFTMRGTHTGPWLGIAPTGKRVAIPMMTIHRIQQAKIVEDWVLVGSLALFQQLGLVPETPQIIATASKR
jgi:predicted ester cyclase